MRIRGGTIITPQGRREADLVVEGETIAAVEQPAPGAAGPDDVNAAGLWVLPGGVDPHTHFGMPLGGGLASLGWRESSLAALLGGTTTVIDFANPERGESLPAAVARRRTMADPAVLCDYGLHCTITDPDPDRLAEIPGLVGAGVSSFKGFLAYPGRLMLEPQEMEAVMRAVKAAGGLLLVHAEDGHRNAAAERILLNTGRIAPHWHPLAHPAESELEAVSTALELAARTGCPLEIVHASLSASIDRIAAARDDRSGDAPPPLAEVCLHHLFAEEGLYEQGHEAALAAICSPPLRATPNGAELLARLADGRIDFLATDHCEFDLKTKTAAASGGFPKVPNGCGGVGERLVVSHTLAVVPGILTPERWVEVTSERPAALLGLGDRKGRLEPGYDADVVLFDPREEYRWRPAPGSDALGSLWAGLPVTGRVRDVWLRGLRAVESGRPATGLAPGRFQARSLPRERSR